MAGQAESAEVWYRQLEQRYRTVLENYERDEAAYREAVGRSPGDPAVADAYASLAKLREHVQKLHNGLRQLRSRLATARETVL